METRGVPNTVKSKRTPSFLNGGAPLNIGDEPMPFEFFEDIKPIIDFAISVLALVALIFFIALMFKVWEVCVKLIAFFNFFTLHQSAIREMISQIERFCRKYANSDE